MASPRLPKAPSVGEETFARDCRAYGLEPIREFPFCQGRKWRFDFFFPAEKLAVEVEGGTAFGKSRHSRGESFENDARKYNKAALMGIKVLRFTTAMVLSAEAIDSVREAVNAVTTA